MRPTILLGLFLVSVTHLHALEIHFRPSFVELVSDGVSQRVRPGELVEVPVGESTMEMEVSEQSPRTVELRALGRCEFRVFGAVSVLEDSGKMSISMDPATKKLDIGWIKGEMKSAPSSFDKSAAAAFFASSPDDFMRPLEFSGVRPFGYTDALEGRASMVAEGDWRNLPPLPDEPRRPGGYSRSYAPDRLDRYEDPDMVRDWRTFEEEQTDLPPLSLPPPTRERRAASPTQVLVLSPSTPSKQEPTSADEDKEEASEKTESGEENGSSVKEKGSSSSSEEEPAASPSPAESPASPEGSPASQPPAAAAGVGAGGSGEVPLPEAKPKSDSASPPEAPSLDSEPENEASEVNPAQPPVASRAVANGEKDGGQGESLQTPTAPTRIPAKTATAARQGRVANSGPTLYDRIVAQEEKQKEVIELLREVSKQVEEIKSVPTPTPSPTPSSTPDPTLTPASKGVEPSPSPAPSSSPVVPPQPPQPEISSLQRSSSSPQSVQPVGSSSTPMSGAPVALDAAPAPLPFETKGAKETKETKEPAVSRVPKEHRGGKGPRVGRKAEEARSLPETSSSSVTATTEDWDFSLEAVGERK